MIPCLAGSIRSPPARLRARLTKSRTPYDIVHAVQSLGSTLTADDLLTLVMRAYLLVPPNEAEMRALSTFHQACAGRGDASEYATLTTLLGAQEALMLLNRSHAQLQRTLQDLRRAASAMRDVPRTRSCPEFGTLLRSKENVAA